jgi:uncharacterized protein (UPF0335 family)
MGQVMTMQNEDYDSDDRSVAGERLKSFIERIERLEEEKADIAEDIKEIYAEVKAVGFDAKTIKNLIKIRKQDAQKVREERELLELYADAIQMELF